MAPGDSCRPATRDTRSPVCVLGHDGARELFRGARVGEWLRIGDRRCRVLGMLAQQGLAVGFNVDELVIMPVATAQALFNTSAVFRILVEAKSRDPVQAAKDDALEIIKARHAGKRTSPSSPRTPCSRPSTAIFGMITAGLAGIAAISLAVAGILIMNVMLVAVTQRTRGDRAAQGRRRAEPRRSSRCSSPRRCCSLLGAAPGSGSARGDLGAHDRVYPVLDFAAPLWASASRRRRRDRAAAAVRDPAARRAARLDPVAALSRRDRACAADDFVRLIATSLAAHRLRSTLTALGIAIGIAGRDPAHVDRRGPAPLHSSSSRSSAPHVSSPRAVEHGRHLARRDQHGSPVEPRGRVALGARRTCCSPSRSCQGNARRSRATAASARQRVRGRARLRPRRSSSASRAGTFLPADDLASARAVRRARRQGRAGAVRRRAIRSASAIRVGGERYRVIGVMESKGAGARLRSRRHGLHPGRARRSRCSTARA